MAPRAFTPWMPLLVMLELNGCLDDVGTAGIEGTADTSGGAADSSGGTSGADGSSTTPLGMSETGMGEVGPCEDPQVIPPPPVDCSGADGVLTQSVIIEEGGDDPSILEGVVRVEGAIRINRTSLTNLDFMACVQEVTRDVTIFGNEQLVDIGGLWSLSALEDFVFSQNDAIEVFDGLPNLSVIPGSIVMRENAGLRQIDGFHRLVGLEGLGIDPATDETVGGNLTVQENPVLERIDGMIGLKVLRGRVQLTNNPMLCVSSVFAVLECIEDPPDDGWCPWGPCGHAMC